MVARRDGELKFMFRVADIRPRYQVNNKGVACALRVDQTQLLCAAVHLPASKSVSLEAGDSCALQLVRW